MTYKLKISSQNQITLPVDLISILGIKAGMYISINPDGDDFKIINTRKKVAKLAGSLKKYVKDKSRLLKTNAEFEEALDKSKTEYYTNQKI